MLGPENYAKLVQRFQDEMEALLVWFEADETSDAAEIAAKSHKVAGSAAVFGATGVRDRLRQIETAAKAGEVSGVEALAADLSEVWAVSRDRLL